MKKLFSMFMAFLMSLSSNTSYNLVEEKPYTGEYYRVSIEEAPDYRDYYSAKTSTTAEASCKTTKYTANGKIVEGTSGYWLGNNQELSLDAVEGFTKELKTNDSINGSVIDRYSVVGCFSQGQLIIMPFSGELITESCNNDGKSMTVDCANPNNSEIKYRLKIENMQCWYCDVGRDGAIAQGGGILFHTSDEKKGTSIRAGCVLGVATPDTKVTFVPINSAEKKAGICTPKQFYLGTYTVPPTQ